MYFREAKLISPLPWEMTQQKRMWDRKKLNRKQIKKIVVIDASLEVEKDFFRSNAFEKHLPLCVVLCNCIRGPLSF